LQANRWNIIVAKKIERNNALTSEHPTIRGPSFCFLHYQRQVEPVMIKAVEGLSPIIFQHFGHFRLDCDTWPYTSAGRLFCVVKECNLDKFTISTLNSSYQFDTYI